MLDLATPRLGDEACYRERHDLDRDVKVIMRSGYNEQEVIGHFVGWPASSRSPTRAPISSAWSGKCSPRRAGEAANIHVQAKLRPSEVRDQLGHHPM